MATKDRMIPQWFTELGRRSRSCVLAAALISVALLAYGPALRGGFVWDDDTSLTHNPLVQSASGLRELWGSTAPADYWPVTGTAYWLEWRAWGLRPQGYHAVNLGLHLGSCFLLWAILARLRLPGAWLGAALFAVHPVNVESVAWIAQLKNVLALAFYLGAILSFLHSGWIESAPVCRPPPAFWKWYGLSLLLFLLALLSKGSIAFLPLVLLGLVLCRRRIRRGDVLLLLPYLVAGTALAAVNVWFQGHRLEPGDALRHAGGLERLLGAGAVVWFYLGKALLPVSLCFIYPLWRIDTGNPLWYLPLAAALGLTAGLAAKARPLGWCWAYFCAALAPVMGFADVYFMKFSLVADHYQYPALAGIAALAGFGWSRWRRTWPAADVVAAGVLCACVLLTRRQCRDYRDAITLYQATVARNPDCALACYNLGIALLDEGRYGEAALSFEQGLRAQPDSASGDLNLGNALRALGRRREALDRYRLAWALQPSNAEAHYNAGVVWGELGDAKEAIAQYRRALELRSDYAEARVNLAMALRDTGSVAEAIAEFRRALALRPDSAEIYNDLGIGLAERGDLPSAVEHLRHALALRPNYPEAQNNLGNLLRLEGERGEAQAHYERALELQPDYAEARCNFGNLLAAEGRTAEAVGQLREALRCQPDYPEALDGLGNALRSMRRYDEALACYRRALALRPDYPMANRNLLGLLRALGRDQ